MLPGTVADDHTTQQDLLRVLESTDMLSIEMAPQPSAFVGPVAVLISRRTSSTAEMLADTLASSGRATLIGETSGGRPTLTREVDVGQGWVLRAPAYQYFGAGGSVKLGKGLNPQIKASRDAAPKVAAEHLLRELGVTRPVAVGSMPAP
jgi:C-terminal processing protease CtpA/Prc